MTDRTKRRALLTLLVLTSVLASAAIVVSVPRLAILHNDPFVGTWELVPPESPGISQFLFLEPDGRFASCRVSDSTVKVVQQLNGRWSVDHTTMLLWTDDDENILRKLVGLPRKRVPVFMTGPDEFSFGTPGSGPHTWRRAAQRSRPR